MLDAATGSTISSAARGVSVLIGSAVLGLVVGGLVVLGKLGSGGHLLATFALTGAGAEPGTFSLNCSLLLPLSTVSSDREFALLLDSLLRSGLDNLGPDLSCGLAVQPIIVLGFGLLLALPGWLTLMLWNLGKLSGMIGFRVVLGDIWGRGEVRLLLSSSFFGTSESSVELMGFMFFRCGFGLNLLFLWGFA